MYWHESIRITDWFYILFYRKQRYGFRFGDIREIVPYFISNRCGRSDRLVSVQVHKAWNENRVYRLCVSLILTGALGNIIDSVFYGVLFNESTYSQLATFMPEGGGYAPLLYGKVVDMFYFPIIETNWPAWMPFIGGDHFIFFSPIFNFADAAISCGIIALLLFYSKYLNDSYHVIKKS